MTSERLSIRVSTRTRKGLRRRASAAGRKESDLVRDAIRDYLSRPRRSAYDVLKKAGLIGSVKGLPRDLSSNPEKYMAGFGTKR